MSRIQQDRKKKMLWDTSEKQSKEPVFTIIRKKRKKRKLIRNPQGEKLESQK